MKKLYSNEHDYESIINNIKEAIFQVNMDGILTLLNFAWKDITGYSIEESINQKYLNYIYSANTKSTSQAFDSLISGKINNVKYEIQYLTKQKQKKWLGIFAKSILDESMNIIGISGVINDITERKNAEIELNNYKEHLEEIVEERTKALYEINKKLEYLATHDSLTGILNRYSLENKLKEQIDEIALLFIDIDNFKTINDTYGHAAGDIVLIYIAKHLQKIIDSKHFVARIGGDEFVILLNNISLNESQEIAETLRKTLHEKELYLKDYNIYINITISIGIALTSDKSGSQGILSSADEALYTAKNSGKNRVEIIKSIIDKSKSSSVKL